MGVGQHEYNQVKGEIVPDESQSRLWFVATFAKTASDVERLCSEGFGEPTAVSGPKSLFEDGVVSMTNASDDRGFTTLHRLEFEPREFIKKHKQTGVEEFRYILHAVVLQSYQSHDLRNVGSAATVAYFEFRLFGESVEHWITGASQLLHVGEGAIERQLAGILGTKPQTTYVLSFLHLTSDSEGIPESGLQDVAEMLCAGLPGFVPFDQPLGHRSDGIPPGVLRRSDGWFYYASHRRIGCVMLNSIKPGDSSSGNSGFRKTVFPESFKWNELGTLGIAALESHFLHHYENRLVELDAQQKQRKVVGELTAINIAMLSLRVDLGNGKVSDRHGIQYWYDHVHQGMRLEDRFQRFRDSLLSLLDGRQAEIQSKIESSQNILTTFGLFVAGAFAYTTVRDALASELGSSSAQGTIDQKIPEWLELGFTSSPMNIFGPMLLWGLAAVVIKQVVRTIVSRLRD